LADIAVLDIMQVALVGLSHGIKQTTARSFKSIRYSSLKIPHLNFEHGGENWRNPRASEASS
jgi:hypothetical protein